jgi:uncharacterized protein (UPF0332 family)
VNKSRSQEKEDVLALPTMLPETKVWLEERRRAGNWFDIAPDDEIPIDVSGPERTILHMFQLAFAPEIRRRFDSGLLDDDFCLLFAQLLQPTDCPQIVRLNDQVRGVARLHRDPAMVPDEVIYSTDLKHIVGFDLTEEDLNCGHFTLLWTGVTWMCTFDFRNGRATCAQIVEAARQFLSTARYSAIQGHERASVDNLFSACELLARAELILSHSPAAKSKTHSSISSAINSWGKLGNIDRQFLKLFNKLSNARSSARYDTEITVIAPTGEEFDVVEHMATHLAEGVKQLRFKKSLKLSGFAI